MESAALPPLPDLGVTIWEYRDRRGLAPGEEVTSWPLDAFKRGLLNPDGTMMVGGSNARWFRSEVEAHVYGVKLAEARADALRVKLALVEGEVNIRRAAWRKLTVAGQ